MGLTHISNPAVLKLDFSPIIYYYGKLSLFELPFKSNSFILSTLYEKGLVIRDISENPIICTYKQNLFPSAP